MTAEPFFAMLEFVAQPVRFTIALRLYDHVVHKGLHLLRRERNGDQEFSGFLISKLHHELFFV